MKKYLFIILISAPIVFFPQITLAWGSLSHMIINHEAYKKVYGETDNENYKIFIMTGQSTDMICYFSSTKGYGIHAITGSDRFNYAHNLIDYNNGLVEKLLNADNDDNSKGDPTFGKFLVRAFNETEAKYPDRFNEKDKFFALGWTGHQLGDRQAHGTTGYLKRIGGNHEHNELKVDVYLYSQYKDNPEFLRQLKSEASTKLMHEASILAYNFLTNSANQKIVSRLQGILTDKRADTISKKWVGWLGVYKKLVSAETLLQKIKDFKPPSYFQDYFSASVNDIITFLNNPNTDIPENTLTFKDRLKDFGDSFLAYFKIKPSLAQEDENLLTREAFYQFFFDLANQAEQNGALQTNETIIDPGLPTERIEYSSEILDDAGFDQALQTTINDYKNGADESGGVMGRYMDNLINTEMSFDEALQNAIKPEDTTPPAIAINSPAERKYLHSENLIIDFSVSDEESGVASAAAFLNGELVSQGQKIDLSLKPLGQYIFKVSAQDNEKNTSEKIVTFQIIATIQSLISNTNHYASLGLIKSNISRFSLLAKLLAADLALKFNKVRIAKGLLNSFIYEVQTLKNKKITPLAADLLIEDARYIIKNL